MSYSHQKCIDELFLKHMERIAKRVTERAVLEEAATRLQTRVRIILAKKRRAYMAYQKRHRNLHDEEPKLMKVLDGIPGGWIIKKIRKSSFKDSQYFNLIQNEFFRYNIYKKYLETKTCKIIEEDSQLIPLMLLLFPSN